jgi:hypothetical protein
MKFYSMRDFRLPPIGPIFKGEYFLTLEEIPKRRYIITALHCVIFQKSADLKFRTNITVFWNTTQRNNYSRNLPTFPSKRLSRYEEGRSGQAECDRSFHCASVTFSLLDSFTLLSTLYLYSLTYNRPIPVIAQSKAWVKGRSLAGIVGSNRAGGMDVCLLWVLCVVR